MQFGQDVGVLKITCDAMLEAVAASRVDLVALS